MGEERGKRKKCEERDEAGEGDTGELMLFQQAVLSRSNWCYHKWCGHSSSK